ncbi:MAG TPA: rod shape-determining protein RodA [Gaiellaceae bacterium]|nr:rod shape-determining protein RodA [Gaiellaceae bacterium]
MDVASAPRPLPTRFRRAERAAAVGAFVRSLDWLLLATVGALVAYGLWAIAGVTKHDVAGNERYYVVRQGIYAAMGGIGLVAALLLPVERLRGYRRGFLAALVALLLLVLLAAEFTRGSKRWIDLGFFQFQPSEFGKVLFVLVVAGAVADAGKRIAEWSVVVRTIGLALIPIGLVFVQPDLGTALVYCAAIAAILFVGGVRWTHLLALGVVAAAAAAALLWALPAAGVEVLKPYQTDRLTGFRNPDSDPSGSTYNVNQSITAVGAGGLRGRGVDGATQTNLDYLPEHATDFVFASLAEQRGFFGASALLLLYLLLLWRGIRIVSLAPDAFSMLVAAGIVFMLLFQIFVNVGMTMGIAPVTGIPLPFLSVGGSSMVTNLVAMGLLVGIHARGRAAQRR